MTGSSVPRPNSSDEGDEIVRSRRKRRGRVNPLVVGSSPTGPTRFLDRSRDIVTRMRVVPVGLEPTVLRGRRADCGGAILRRSLVGPGRAILGAPASWREAMLRDYSSSPYRALAHMHRWPWQILTGTQLRARPEDPWVSRTCGLPAAPRVQPATDTEVEVVRWRTLIGTWKVSSTGAVIAHTVARVSLRHCRLMGIVAVSKRFASTEDTSGICGWTASASRSYMRGRGRSSKAMVRCRPLWTRVLRLSNATPS